MSLEDVSYGNVLIWRQQYIIKISKNISCVLLHTLEHGEAIDFNLSPLHSIGPTTHLNPNKVHRSQISSLKGIVLERVEELVSLVTCVWNARPCRRKTRYYSTTTSKSHHLEAFEGLSWDCLSTIVPFV